jgi:hypothetical protein
VDHGDRVLGAGSGRVRIQRTTGTRLHGASASGGRGC